MKMKHRYLWLILAVIAGIFVFVALQYVVCKKTTEIITSKKKSKKKKFYGRLVVKFSLATPRWTKERFFRKMGLKPIAFNIFGFDIAGWDSPKKVKKNLNAHSEFHYFLLSLGQIDTARVFVDDYEIETLEPRTIKPLYRFQEARETYKNKQIVPWYEKYVQIEAAHKFLKEKKVKLAPTGVVIIDNGPELTHPDIAPMLKRDKNGKLIYWVWNKDEVRFRHHGTHVSCLAGGFRDKRGADGIVAPNSYLLPLIVNYKDPSAFFVSDIAIGLMHYWRLEQKGEISFRAANMSFQIDYSKIVFSAMKTLNDKLFVVAAGNSKMNLDKDKNYYPAAWDLPNKIAVAATGQNDGLAWFSNYGKDTVEIAAPGVGILSCINGGSYGRASGTSMASPLVAGSASLIFSMDKRADVDMVKNVLFFGADSVGGLLGKVKFGNRLNVDAAVRQMWLIKNWK